jgi:hypothetical protein
MSRFWDKWATEHRNWGAIVTGAGVILILAWGIAQLWSAEIVKITFETAVVREVRTLGTSAADNSGGGTSRMRVQLGSLELKDGSTIEILLVPPIPQAGDKILLKVEHYDDGSRTYSIDRLRSQLYNPE